MLNQDISWYDTTQTADFASRLSIDMNKIEEGLGEKVPLFIIHTAQWVSCLCIVLITDWQLFLICTIPVPFSVGVMVFFISASSKLNKKGMDAYGAADALAEEAFTAIKTVVAFGGQRIEKERYDKFLRSAKNINIRRAYLTAASTFFVFFSMYCTLFLSFWYGSKFFTRDKALLETHGYSPGKIITIFICVLRAVYSFSMSLPYLDVIAHTKGAVQKIFAVIDSNPTINASKGKGRKLDKVDGGITFRNVHFSYPSRPEVEVLQGLNLNIKAGDTVALVANSGCGKSTCMQLIQRFYDPTSGEIYIDGHNLKELDLTWLRRHIGVVSQEPVLFETTIAENIKLGYQSATQEDIEKAAKKAYAHTFISSLPLGYNTLVGERGVQLSGGQKQRIAIARALVRKPAILLLDEATSALDAAGEALVQSAMDLASIECTTIIVAHRLSTVRKASRILAMADGKIQEDGTHSGLMQKRGIYYHLVSSQIQSEETSMSEAVSENHLEITKIASNPNGDMLTVQPESKTEVSESPSLWFVLKMISPETCQIVLACLASISIGASLPIWAIVFGGIIGTFVTDDVLDFQSSAASYAIFFLILTFVRTLAKGTQIYMFAVSGEMLSMRLRSRMFETILNQEVGWFDHKANGVGSLCAQLSAETANVQGAANLYVGVVLNALSATCIGIGVCFYFEWRLSLVTICFSSITVVSCYLYKKFVSRESASNCESLKASSKIATEAIGNIRTVASLGCESTLHKSYASALTPYHKMAQTNMYVRGLVYGIPRSSTYFAYAAAIYYGAVLMRDSGVSPSSIFTIGEALVLGCWALGNALTFAPIIQKGLISVNRIFRLLSLNIEHNVSETYNKGWGEGDISFEDVHFTYPTRPSVEVLKGVDLSVLQGKTVALVGPSGCGKSTIVQLLLGFYDCSHGKITVDGKHMKTIDKRHLRPYLGVVSQEPNLFNRTIAENIAYGDNNRAVSKEEIVNAAMRANIHTFIAALPLGYDTNLGERGAQLSGGQKQRLAIARALIRNPKVLLLDEATSALDAKSGKIVQVALDDAKMGRSCITIAHRLSTIQDADVICAINRGRIIEMGTHSELMSKRGFYHSLYSLQGGSD